MNYYFLAGNAGLRSRARVGTTRREVSPGGSMVAPKAARWGLQSRTECGGFILLEEDGRSKWMSTVRRAGAGPGGLGYAQDLSAP